MTIMVCLLAASSGLLFGWILRSMATVRKRELAMTAKVSTSLTQTEAQQNHNCVIPPKALYSRAEHEDYLKGIEKVLRREGLIR